MEPKKRSLGAEERDEFLRAAWRALVAGEAGIDAGTGGGDGQPLVTQGRQGARDHIEGCGCELLYLPPYSPDFNPIEQAFSKIKGLMRKAEARTPREALIEAMGLALEAVSARDARGFFNHCGYRSVGQPL
jgi:DDE superfamily endonuclease